MKCPLLYQMPNDTLDFRLKLGKPPCDTAKELDISSFDGTKEWRENKTTRSSLVFDPNKSAQCIDLPRGVQPVLNRI